MNIKIVIVLLSILLINACSNNDSKVKIKKKDISKKYHDHSAHGHHEKTDPNFKPKFIKSLKLFELMKEENQIYIFDVRSFAQYSVEHIKTAYSTPHDRISNHSLINIMALGKDSDIVTYCGCPHHLSVLGAQTLTKLGYTNVKVLDEGYWHWKEKNYPIVVKTAKKHSKLSVEGYLVKNNKPLANIDIFLKHKNTEQLEATRTDENGYYKMDFHLYDYKKNDRFDFYVHNLKGPSVKTFRTNKNHEKDVYVEL